MATYTSYLNLKKPEGGERYSLADFNANWDKIDAALGGKQYNIGQLTSATVADQLVSFANSHKGEHGFTGVFYLSGNAVPSDLPAQTNEWKYAFGFFRIRIAPQNGAADGEAVLFGFNTNNIAVRSMANGVVTGSWSQLATTSQIVYDWGTKTTWLNEAERADSAATVQFTKFGKFVSITITTSSKLHTEDDTIGTIESGFRPPNIVQSPCYIGGTPGWLRINTDGTIKIWLLSPATTGRLYGYAAYALA